MLVQQGGGPASAAVNSTAGVRGMPWTASFLPTGTQGPTTSASPNFLSALAAMTASSAQPQGAAPRGPAYNDPWAVNTPYGAQDVPPQSALAAMAAAAPQAATTAAAAPQQAPASQGPTLGDVLNAILGAAPQAPTAADFGPAPTLADFFSAAPYQQALAQLASGNKTAQGTIAQAFNQAQAQNAANVGVANQALSNELKQEGVASNQALAGVNQDIAQAQALGGPQMAAALAGLKGTATEQNASTNNLDQVLASVQRNNATQDTQALGSQRAAALQYLASQVLGGQNKISLQEAADQAKGQQLLAQANNTRAVDMARAMQQYNTAANTYNNRENTMIAGATKAIGNTTPGGAGWAKSQLGQWAQQAASGNQNAASSLSAAQNLIAPFTPPGSTTQKTPTYAEAVQRLMANANQLGGPNSIAYGIMSDWLNNYYGNTKHSAVASPQAPSQAQVAQYLQDTYLPS